MKILIATPAYGSVVYSVYHDAVLKTVAFFNANFPGIEFESHIMSISMVTTARNLFASRVLNDPSFTHLLFIDADMGFQPSLIARMLSLQRPVVGIIAPQRKLDFESYHLARAKTDRPALARVIANEYVSGDALLTQPGSDGKPKITVTDGFVRVTHCGTGIMLIERGVLEAMRDRYPALHVPAGNERIRKMGVAEGGVLLQCFNPANDQYGIALGEDVSFCLRWSSDMGGEIWANVDEPIVHVGQENHTGHFLTKLSHSPVTLDIVETATED